MSGQKPREIALRVLMREPGEDFIEHLLDKGLSQANPAPVDRRLVQELVYGVVRWQGTLDWLIARKARGSRQGQLLLQLLRLGLYQIFWLERIPNHAAVHETVELAKASGLGSRAGVVNAILRGYLREAESTRELLANLKTNQPYLGYSHPEWLVKRWVEHFGREKTIQLLDWNNRPPNTFARVNTLKAEAGKLLTQWRDEGVEYDFVRQDWIPENLVFELKGHPPLAKLPSFQQGLFYIQDPSTLLAVERLDPQPGETILDFCAAPGGKLSYIAQHIRNEGRLIAQDLSAERLQLITDNCVRLGVSCVRPALSSSPDLEERTGFDRILVDAPCSNTGVIRRRVDLRWRLAAREITRLSGVQLDLLEQAAGRLKRGGLLVYSTCSLEREENEEVVEKFLANHPDFRLAGSRRLAPFQEGVDGAFVAQMLRT